MAQHPVLEESTFDAQKREWTHNPCGTVLMGKEVHYSIHNSGLPLAGFGDVRRVTVPYCPTCQTEPPDRGILDEDPVEVREAEILRRMRSRHGG